MTYHQQCWHGQRRASVSPTIPDSGRFPFSRQPRWEQDQRQNAQRVGLGNGNQEKPDRLIGKESVASNPPLVIDIPGVDQSKSAGSRDERIEIKSLSVAPERRAV